MKIAEAAAESGLSVDTIRFYEKSGLLPSVTRGADGHRRFSPDVLRWLVLLEKLRSTGMPLAEVRRYTTLVSGGPETVAERRALLERHRTRLAETEARLHACRALVDGKIEMYAALMEDRDPLPGSCCGG